MEKFCKILLLLRLNTLVLILREKFNMSWSNLNPTVLSDIQKKNYLSKWRFFCSFWQPKMAGLDKIIAKTPLFSKNTPFFPCTGELGDRCHGNELSSNGIVICQSVHYMDKSSEIEKKEYAMHLLFSQYCHIWMCWKNAIFWPIFPSPGTLYGPSLLNFKEIIQYLGKNNLKSS